MTENQSRERPLRACPPTWDDAALRRVHEVPDKARRVQAMFDAIEARYERVNTVTTLGLDGLWRRRLVRHLVLPPGAAVLDLACGTGQVLRLIRRRRREAGLLVGADFSEEMIRHARRVDSAGAAFCQADALRLPFAERSFDAVTCVFGVRNFADPTRGLAEIFRVLRPGGMAGILEFSMPRTAVLAGLYRFYFRRVLPRLAGRLSGDRGRAYDYLQKSVEAFEDADLAGRMRACGFEQVGVRRLTFGVVQQYSGRKPSGEHRT